MSGERLLVRGQREGRAADAEVVALSELECTTCLVVERRALYTDFILYALSGPAREALEIEMNLSDYEFKSEFFRKKLAEEAARTEAHAVLKVLAARGIPVSDEQRARILSCSDMAILDRWIGRAATAATTDEVVRDG